MSIMCFGFCGNFFIWSHESFPFLPQNPSLNPHLQVVPDMPPLLGERSIVVGERGATRPPPPEVVAVVGVVTAADLVKNRVGVVVAAVGVAKRRIIATKRLRRRQPRETLTAAEVEGAVTMTGHTPTHRHHRRPEPMNTFRAITPNRVEVHLQCPFLQQR